MGIKACVPQGSVLCPLLFLVYINALTDNTSFGMHLLADDSSLFTCVNGIDQTQQQTSLGLIHNLHLGLSVENGVKLRSKYTND